MRLKAPLGLGGILRPMAAKTWRAPASRHKFRPYSRSLTASLSLLFLLCAVTNSLADASTVGKVGGATCKGLAFVTAQIKKSKTDPIPTAAETAAPQAAVNQAMADRMADSGLTPDELDANVKPDELAAMMSDFNDEANAPTAPKTSTPAPAASQPSLTSAPAAVEGVWTPYDYARASMSAAGLADPTGATSVVAAYLYPKCSSPDAQKGKGTFCWKDSVVRGVGLIPKACDASHPDFQNGLCYQGCPAGMSGDGPVCWTQQQVSQTRGAGVVPASCPSDHPDRQAGLCYEACPDGYNGIGPVCWKGLKSHARGAGIVASACDSAHSDMDAGLCYTACAAGYTGKGPVCWTDSKVSHPRGVGVLPTGCPADHPNLDAGLCYQNCSTGNGVGPVCWATCTGRFNTACGAGCADSKIDCGFATSDMVTSPLEMAGNILSLGTASAETAAARDAEAATEAESEKLAKMLAEDATKRAADEAALRAAIKVQEEASAKGEEVGLSALDYLYIMGEDTEEDSQSAWSAFKNNVKAGAAKAKARAEHEVKMLKSQAGDKFVEKLKAIKSKAEALEAKREAITPTRQLANKMEKSELSAAFLKKLEAAGDKIHVKQLSAGESFIAGCAKFGATVSKQALGL